ncbi:uncharacterized protein DS421_11g328470 [Arachis hypogaea]|nr:uncharacterized protein DS421_11g328470 [Arachis hypogaea]
MAHQVGHDGDINRLNETFHYVGAAEFEKPRLLLLRQVSHILPPSDAIVPYLAKAGFSDMVPLRDFTFENSLISALVERWRPETHTFHLPWGEVVQHRDVGHGGAAPWCQASGGGTAGDVEEGVVYAEAGLVAQVQQSGARTLATASLGLRRAQGIIIGLCSAGLDLPVTVFGGTAWRHCVPLLQTAPSLAPP